MELVSGDYRNWMYKTSSNVVVGRGPVSWPVWSRPNWQLAQNHRAFVQQQQKVLDFHYLILECIKFKAVCMCFHAINGSDLPYLSELLHVYTPSRTLRPSSDFRILKGPAMQTQDAWLSLFFLLWTWHFELTTPWSQLLLNSFVFQNKV